jgi:cytochrome c-type biogenesis protein CcmH
MTAFVLAASLMIATALGFLLPPLLGLRLRSSGAVPSEANLAVIRAQARELESDRATGLLNDSAFEESRRELERRVVEDVAADKDWKAAAPGRPGRWVAVVVGAVVPVLAASLYLLLGTPRALQAPADATAVPDHSAGHSTSPEQMESMVTRLAQRLSEAPDDGDGWAMLARSYAVLGRHAQAVPAYQRAAALQPDDAQLLADYADALAVTHRGRVDGQPLRLVQRALRIDPDNVKALALAGTAAFDRKDYAKAVALWEHAVGFAPAGEPFTAALEASLAEARSLTTGKTAEPGVATAPASIRAVSGVVTLAPELAGRAAPQDSVLIFARAASGPRMPVAVLRHKVSDLPLEFVLDDSAAMTPAVKLSDFDRVMIVVRVSKVASAQSQPGDLEGTAGPLTVGTRNVRVRIDRVLP